VRAARALVALANEIDRERAPLPACVLVVDCPHCGGRAHFESHGVGSASTWHEGEPCEGYERDVLPADLFASRWGAPP
jgi:hypothetical protein